MRAAGSAHACWIDKARMCVRLGEVRTSVRFEGLKKVMGCEGVRLGVGLDRDALQCVLVFKDGT